jgi:hypothetical protein
MAWVFQKDLIEGSNGRFCFFGAFFISIIKMKGG